MTESETFEKLFITGAAQIITHSTLIRNIASAVFSFIELSIEVGAITVAAHSYES